MGWSEEQTLHTSIPAIIAAHAGRVDMLKAIFGGKDEPTKTEQNQPASPGKIRAALAPIRALAEKARRNKGTQKIDG
jgi:hypothetical protein